MKILAIETSCDETACAVIEDGTKIITNVVATSTAMHEKWGGIVPEVAAREQLKAIIPVIIEALNPYATKIMGDTGGKAPGGAQQMGGSIDDVTHKNISTRKVAIKNQLEEKVSSGGKETRGRTHLVAYHPIILKNIDAVAVTVGPGLIGSLLIGTEVAKTIAYVTGIPIIPVNHVLAHMYANFLDSDLKNSPITFPAISLVVSGGHTELFLMTSPKDLKWLGGTIDDAAGEAFDKTARLLGFGSRGGLAIQESASAWNLSQAKSRDRQLSTVNIKLPRPMMYEDNLIFSFSGLKTAILREVNKLKTVEQLNNETIVQLSYEVQEAITDVLVKKTLKAAEHYQAKSILLGGGVAANIRLREKFQSTLHFLSSAISFHCPPVSFCTDNAAYIGAYAYFRGTPVDWHQIDAHPDLSVEI
jgi:N6-L-threonylcarbamoyladenine synthase